MSTKDMRYFRQCPICADRLDGTDDGLEVFLSLQGQLTEIDEGKADYKDPNCTLCGENCPVDEARKIVADGEPKLNRR